MKACLVKLNLFLVLFFLTIVFSSSVLSGEYEDYLKSQQESFQSYKDARDGEFIGFLKDQWKEFKMNQGLKRDNKPKPSKVPVARIPKKAEIEPVISKPIKKIILPKVDIPKPVIDVKPEPNEKVNLIIDFYNMRLKFMSDFKLPQISLLKINKGEITKFWDMMSKSDYEDFIAEIRNYQKELKLNDWGYHNLMNTYGLKKYGNNQNIANLFVWFMSSKSGYDARIGYNNNKIFLLLPSRNNLFGIPFLKMKQKKYYAMAFGRTPDKFKSIYTYKGNYPKANKLMDYRLLDEPLLISDIKARKLAFKYAGKKYVIDSKYDKGLIDYFKFYPQTNIKVYFDAAPIPETEYSLIKNLKPILEGKSEAEAVNIILRFVQTSLKYKTDAAQFGREKYLLPNESIYYPYCDCEDRAFLFSFLVKKLTGLDVVGLDYPGHISTAVRFSDNLKGDYIVLNNKKYMICDPTYINAGVGMAMPKFKHKKPKVIKLM